MASNYIEKDLGLVTAYGEAVVGGYKGTREQFQQMIANYMNYNSVTNKPSINGVTLQGNKTSSDLGITSTTSYTNITNKPSINGVTLQGEKTLKDFGIHKTWTPSLETTGAKNDLIYSAIKGDSVDLINLHMYITDGFFYMHGNIYTKTGVTISANSSEELARYYFNDDMMGNISQFMDVSRSIGWTVYGENVQNTEFMTTYNPAIILDSARPTIDSRLYLRVTLNTMSKSITIPSDAEYSVIIFSAFGMPIYGD